MRNQCYYLILAFLLSPLFTFSQNVDKGPIYVFTYMKSTPGQTQDYINCETKVWKKIHQELKKKGEINDWSFWQVVSPIGSEVGYDFVLVKVLPDWKGIEESPDYTSVFNKMDWSREERELFAKTSTLRTIVKSETYLYEGGVENGREDRANFAALNYMKTPPGGNNNYFEMELKYFKPWFTVVVQNKKREGWCMLSLQFPWGEEVGYNGITIDYFNNLNQKFIDLDKDWEELHWMEDLSEVVDEMDSRRTLVKGMLMKRIDKL